MAQPTHTAAELAAHLDQKRLDQQMRNRELAQTRQAAAVKMAERQRLLVESELDGADHTKVLAALDAELAQLGQAIEAKAAAAAHLPAVLAELERRHVEAQKVEALAAQRRHADTAHAAVDKIQALFKEARTIQTQARVALMEHETLRSSSVLASGYMPAPTMVRDNLSRFIDLQLPE